jgi:fatty acid desaturase
MSHPHDYIEDLPDKPHPDAIRALSRIEPLRVLRAIAAEWLLIAIAVALSQRYWHPLLYPAVLVFIAARQHALMVLGHDASHYTLLRPRWLNDLVGDLFLFWPNFFSVGVFRFFHRDHHRYLATAKDANRELWRTHTPDGEMRPEWRYPKSRAALVGLLSIKMSGARGVLWVVKGVLSMFARPEFRQGSWLYVAARSAFYAAIGAALWYFDLATEFLLYWVAPFCTWHVVCEYIRLICEHSAVPVTQPPYHLTRTTLPRTWERWLILPRHIGYHHEHHWYPSVPFYRLPELHALLVSDTRFGLWGRTSHGVFRALGECVTRRTETPSTGTVSV